jgi:protein-disulfide isomerase
MKPRRLWSRLVPALLRPRGLLVFLALAACGGAGTPCPAPPPAATVAPTLSGAPSAPVAVTAASEDDAAVPIGPTDPSWGSRAALVTIVEFSDFQCPFCARVEPTLALVREKYGPDKVRIVWKNEPLPFHPNARPAAEASAGVYAMAGNAAFWRFHDAAFAAQKDLGSDSYARWAQDAGVSDIAAFKAGLEDHRWGAKIDADMAVAKDVGAVGTPSFFLNGIAVTGAQPFDKFQSVIDLQIIAAQAKIASGTPAERVYAVLSKENRAADAAAHHDEDDDEQPDEKTVFKIPVGKSPARGAPGALVTIIEFGDYQCPFSARVDPTLRELRTQYGDKLRLVYKDQPLPFHERAEPAAQAALEVRAEKGDAAFWTMHDALYDNQRDLSDDNLVRLATAAGAQEAKVRAAIAGHLRKAAIDADADLVEDFQANGTPHFFINGRRVIGAQPKAKFVAIIDEEMKRAQALLVAGTKPEALYDALVKDGKGPPEPERKTLAALPPGDPARGPATARVTIHEFADFQCPFCARVEPTLKQVEKAYGDKVRFVWHDLPLPMHPDAPLAAEAAREALRQRGPAAFWKMHDELFVDPQKLKRDDLDDRARALGLDMPRWAAALDGRAHKAEIDADDAGAKDMSISGTPAFLVVAAGSSNAYFINGAQPYAKFRKTIERALAEGARGAKPVEHEAQGAKR